MGVCNFLENHFLLQLQKHLGKVLREEGDKVEYESFHKIQQITFQMHDILHEMTCK